jgi:hypothetical protein
MGAIRRAGYRDGWRGGTDLSRGDGYADECRVWVSCEGCSYEMREPVDTLERHGYSCPECGHALHVETN